MKILLVTILLLFSMIGSPVKAATIILTSDKQLNDLLDPDKKIDLSTGRNKRSASLREICETAQKTGDKTLTIAFDEFFRQYREQAGTDRRLTPDMDEYVDADDDSHRRCPSCRSVNLKVAPLPSSTLWFSVALLGLPLLFIKRDWTCAKCGHEWSQ